MALISEKRRRQIADRYQNTVDLLILVIGNVGRRMSEWADRKAEMRRFPDNDCPLDLDRMEDWWRYHGSN
jgi:hypothetical protein